MKKENLKIWRIVYVLNIMLKHISLVPLAAESLGARSMCN